MDYMTELVAIARSHSGIIETKTATQHGISKVILYKLCKEDKIHRIVKGQYIIPENISQYGTEPMFLDIMSPFSVQLFQ